MSSMHTQTADRVHELCRLATEHRLADRPADAVRAAREAHALANTSGDDHAQAHAAFVLGSALLDEFLRGAEILFREAIQRLDDAAARYERLDRVDFSSVLLTMAEAFHAIDELDSARGLFGRVTAELADPKWSRPPELARHVDHLRGRAFLGLGRIALDLEEEAGAFFEAAANLLVASGSPAAVPHLDELAELIEDELDDPDGAKQIRAAAKRLTAS